MSWNRIILGENMLGLTFGLTFGLIKFEKISGIEMAKIQDFAAKTAKTGG